MNNSYCRLCNCHSIYKFSLEILYKYSVKYYECSNCYSLQTEPPFWLEEAYKNNISKLDTGALQRNLNNFVIAYTFCKIFNVRTALDFGSSDGLLCRFLRDRMVDAYCVDKYTSAKYAQNFTIPPSNIGNPPLLQGS